jgi:spore photoproduct lyase
MAFVPTVIFIEEGLENSPAAVRARAAAPYAEMRRFPVLTELSVELERLPAAQAKRCVAVARRAGGFVKEFPAGPGIRSSGWQYFIPAIGCPADCRYCFLQTYHTANVPIIFAGQDAMLEEIEAKSTLLGGGCFYGGELCDDLMLERFIGVIAPLVALFRRLPSATLELRTKSDEVESLLATGGAPNVIVAWTFTPNDYATRFERGTTPVGDRIKAAATVQEAGFRVGVRLDPLMLTHGWQQAYMELVDELADSLDPGMVESVHLGGLRFTAGLKAFVSERFGYEEPFCGEFVRCSDGKSRYPRPLRVAAYDQIAKKLRAWNKALKIRLCMETPEAEADFARITGICTDWRDE